MINLFQSSLVLSITKYFFRIYISVEDRIDTIYRESKLYGSISGLCKGLSFCFRCSLLGRITEMKGYKDFTVINESGFLNFFRESYIKCKNALIGYVYSSAVSGALKKLLNKYLFLPVRALSCLVILTIFCNIVFKFLLKETIGLLEWFVQSIFLFISLGGLSSNAGWEDLKKTSFILRNAGLGD